MIAKITTPRQESRKRAANRRGMFKRNWASSRRKARPEPAPAEPAANSATTAAMRAVLEGQIVRGLQLALPRKDGEILWTSWNARTERSEAGIIFCVGRDITDERAQLERIRTLALILERTETAVLLTDFDHRVVWTNEAFERLTGFTLAQLQGRRYLELDGRCISYRLGLLERGRLYDYNLAFVPQYADLGSGRVLLQEWIDWGLDEGWTWIDASRVSLENSSHQLHERMTGQVEHLRHSFYSWRPTGVCLGLALRAWQHLKPWLKRRRTPAAPTAVPQSTAQERPDAVPSHSQR